MAVLALWDSPLLITMHSRCSWITTSLHEHSTLLHRVASTAREKVFGVRFRGVVSAERYKTDGTHYIIEGH